MHAVAFAHQALCGKVHWPDIAGQLCAETFEYQRPDEHRLLVQLSRFCDGLDIPSNCCRTHHFLVPFDDLVAAGSLASCRERGTLRLEGKDFEVQDGDVINFRFAV